MVLDFSYFKKYHKVAIMSTSNGLYGKPERLGLIYYSVDALKRSILECASDVQVDLLDAKPNKELCLIDISTIKNNDYDAAVIMNHTAAFFAGTLPKPFKNALMFLDGYEGDVWWCYDTPAYFPIKTHVDIIKQYGKYSYKPYNAELSRMLEKPSFKTSLDDIDERLNIISDICIEDIPGGLVNASDYSRRTYDRIKSTFYIKSNLAKKIGTLYSSKNVWNDKKYDICLAFNYDNYRFSLAKKYIDDDRLSIASIRHSPGEGFRCKVHLEPRIHNIEKYYEWLETNCYASLLITTRNHLSCLVPERFYGVFNSYCVGFIPIECDPDKMWVKNDELKHFSYVSSKEELIGKTKEIHDKSFFDHIVKLQRNEII